MKRIAAAILIALLATSSAWGADQMFVKPSPKDKCPVCGMFVAKYPDFVAEVSFKDGSYAVFDGAKDMFKYYLNLKKYAPAKRIEDIVSIYVTDYYSLEPIDGTTAWYVAGSDTFGPMGKELIPFSKESDARGFMKDHKGKSLLRFKDVHAELIKGLD
jgi:copper chaperone NosL